MNIRPEETNVTSCLFSSPIGYSVYAVDVPLGIGNRVHSPDRPHAGLKTTGAVDCPRVSAHGGYGHVT